MNLWVSILLFLALECSAITDLQKAKLLSLHNDARLKVLKCQLPGQPSAKQLLNLSWDDELAEKAQRQSDTCQFGHNTNEERITSKWRNWVGQNIAGNPAYENGFAAWFNEYKDYNFRRKSCARVCGHYTQIVWANTKAVGCGVTNCAGKPNFPYGMYLVCNYGPGGNYNNQYPYEAGDCVGR
ncbi:unnamed protein product [Dicrocoelium dendriticum]|nr:unnamed protein product [Dicrocoelium dendriticum]CAH8582667.1 unnamed protein product [Dicrocoelium dendriticum]CAH8582701.1 unnamed protein product [Dicrocoelium dendriticum]